MRLKFGIMLIFVLFSQFPQDFHSLLTVYALGRSFPRRLTLYSILYILIEMSYRSMPMSYLAIGTMDNGLVDVVLGRTSSLGEW